jgi:nucleotide-binding universal stress UspA family protein
MQSVPIELAGESREMVMRGPVSSVTKVVVGVDGSASAAAAVRWAAAEACRRQVVLRIVSAWEELDQADPPHAGDPVRIAGVRVQKALARVLARPHYPHRIACTTPRGDPGPSLLNEAGAAGLLVLGVTRVDPVLLPGRVNRYCLRRGHGPLVFVPAPPSV